LPSGSEKKQKRPQGHSWISETSRRRAGSSAQIHQIPVLFGGGRRLFEVSPSRVELDIVGVIDTPEATHIRYRVRR
jgi:hypothetical protein